MVTTPINGWIQVYRNTLPDKNHRLNELMLDARCPYTKLSVKEASLDAINKIVKEFEGPYNLYCSGGIDSQFLIWAWLQSGIEFNIVHVDYNGQNFHDTIVLDEYCRTLGISYIRKTFDVQAFLNTDEYVELAKRYDCASPHILTYCKMISEDPGTCVTAGNFISAIGCGVNYTIHGLQRFAAIDKRNYIPFFLLYTPELAYSFYYIDLDFRKSNPHDRIDYLAKCHAYKSAGADIIPQTSKFTGFEKIKDSFDNHSIDFKTKIKWSRKFSARPFDLLYRYPLHDHIGDYTERVVLLQNERPSINI